jgi:hypothetical protein
VIACVTTGSFALLFVAWLIAIVGLWARILAGR